MVSILGYPIQKASGHKKLRPKAPMARPKSFWPEMGTNPNKKHRPKGILYPCIDFTW